jgi:hypothetical protein
MKPGEPRAPDWPAERIEWAIARYLAGESAAEIAKALGVSRSAVFGRMHRSGVRRDPQLGLTNNAKAHKHAWPRPPRVLAPKAFVFGGTARTKPVKQPPPGPPPPAWTSWPWSRGAPAATR